MSTPIGRCTHRCKNQDRSGLGFSTMIPNFAQNAFPQLGEDGNLVSSSHEISQKGSKRPSPPSKITEEKVESPKLRIMNVEEPGEARS